MNRLLLVDGHAYAYRAFHAIRGLKSPDGRPTNAIFGFIKMFEKARSLAAASHVAVLWDGGLDEDRLEALPEYKAQRPEMPDDLEVQLDGMQDYLEGAGILSVCREGVEADDLIASAAMRAGRRGYEVIIATNDKDFMQLVSPSLWLLNPMDKQQPLWDEAKVVEKSGVRPHQIVDWLSLVGDSVDNIEGVPGVGPKTAARLLNQFGSIDILYTQPSRVEPERLRGALEAAKARVLRNRSLVRLKCDLDSAPGPEQCAPGAEDCRRLHRLFEVWGFRTLAARYAQESLL